MAENTREETTASKLEITPAQKAAVIAEFKNFGYTPQSEGEIEHWAAKPVGQLFAALQKRKEAEPKGKLSNEEIYKLYDEFGLAERLKGQADYDWAKKNLPNDPESVKKVLKFEQTKKMAEQKAQGMVPKMQTPQTQPIQQMPTAIPQAIAGGGPGYSGQGGATDASSVTSGALNSPTGHLVKFKGDPNGPDQEGDASTLWYVDTNNNVMRPIMSQQAFNDLFNNNAASIAAAKKSINTLDVKSVQPGGQYSNFFLLGQDYGIYSGGKYQKLDFSPKNIQQRYGQPASQLQVQAAADIDKLINFWENSDSGLKKDYLEQIKNDPTVVAGLIGAVAYGGYTYGDVWKELNRKYLANNGDTDAKNSRVIDNNLVKSKYAVTDAGKNANSLYTLPDTVAGMDSTMLNQPITNMPDEFYKTIFSGSEYDPSSPEFMAKAAKVKSDLHDLLLDQLNADTAEAKSLADQKYSEWKTATERTLGISLSNDAYAAWNQLIALQDNASQAGIAGSGISAEAQDKYLASVRRTGQQNRDTTKISEDERVRTESIANASPDEIKKMNEEDAAKGLPRSEWRSVKWGLSPLEEMTSSKFISNYRSKYPDSKLTDDQIKNEQYSQYYDANGNNYSTLYQKQEDARQKAMYGDTVTGRTSSAGSYADVQSDKVIKQNEVDYKNQYDKYNPDTAENPDFGKDPLTINTKTTTQGTGIKESLGTDTATVQKALAGRIKIPDVKTMNTYDPSQYSREADKSVYLKTGITPTTAKKAATVMPQSSSFAVKPGTSYIPNVGSMSKYTDVYKDPNSKKLYGTLKK